MQTEHLHLPVSAEYSPEGWASPGIAFSDFDRMHTEWHVLAPARKLDTPEWATNDAQLREVVVRYLEWRARKTSKGTVLERLTAAEAALVQRRPLLVEQLKNLCREYVLVKQVPKPNRAWLHRREIQIENCDTQLRLLKAPAAKLVSVVHHYYRLGWNATQVAQELGIKPPHVRMLLWRLRKAAANMAGKAQHHGGGAKKKHLDLQRVLSLIEAGKTEQEICSACGFKSYLAIRKRLRAAGLYVYRGRRRTSAAAQAVTAHA